MRDRYDSAHPVAAPLVQEREYTKYLHSIEQFVLSPTGKGAAYWGAIGVGMAFVFMAIAYDKLWLCVPGFGFSFAGAGGLIMLQQRLAEFQPVTNFTTIEYDKLEKQQQDRRKDISFDLDNNLPAKRIYQPTPGAFRQWLIDVLDPAKKLQFSRGQGKERGWTDNEYDVLIVQLKEAGLLHRTEISNHAPICTDEGKRLAREWIKQ